MLLYFICTGLGGIALLLICELLIYICKLKGENARKLVHIVIAIYAASWAFYLDATVIALISVILVSVVIIVQKYPLLHSFKTVKRMTYGEVWYPLGIGLSAILFTNPYVYVIAVLHMGIADGLAAVVGVGMGKEAKRFKVYKQTKSVAGTLVFITTSFVLYTAYWLVVSSVATFSQSVGNTIAISLSSAIIVAFVELFSPKGSDNILVPIAAGMLAILPAIQIVV